MIDLFKMICAGVILGIYYHYSWRFLYETGLIRDFLNFKPFSCDECYALWLSIITMILMLISPVDNSFAIISAPVSMITAKLFSMNYWGHGK